MSEWQILRVNKYDRNLLARNYGYMYHGGCCVLLELYLDLEQHPWGLI